MHQSIVGYYNFRAKEASIEIRCKLASGGEWIDSVQGHIRQTLDAGSLPAVSNLARSGVAIYHGILLNSDQAVKETDGWRVQHRDSARCPRGSNSCPRQTRQSKSW